jgi:hypothetical protein
MTANVAFREDFLGSASLVRREAEPGRADRAAIGLPGPRMMAAVG